MKARARRSSSSCRSAIFIKPLARALIEQRRILALDADAKPRAARGARCALDRAGEVHAGGLALSRPALDLLAAHPRQDRRPVARRGGAAVGHGGDDRGRPALRCRGRAAPGAGGVAPGAGARRDRRGDQEAHRRTARGARQVHAGAGRADAQEPASSSRARSTEHPHAAAAGSQEHDRPARAARALRRQGCGEASCSKSCSRCWKTCRWRGPASRAATTWTTT